MFVCFRSTPAVLDISGFAAIPETPRRPPSAAPASLHVLRRPPLEGEYITVTDSSGSRVYLKQKEDTGTKVKLLTCDAECFTNVVHPQRTCIWCPVPIFLYFFACLSPDGRLQNGAKLPGFTGAAGGANRCVERTRGREGESVKRLLCV